MKGVVLQKLATRSAEPERSKVASSPEMVMRDMDAGGRAVRPAIVEEILALIGAVRQLGDGGAHLGFGEVVEPRHGGDEDVGAVRRAEVADAPLGRLRRRELGHQVALAGHGIADIGEDEVEHAALDARAVAMVSGGMRIASWNVSKASAR